MPVADAETLDWILSWGCYTDPHPWWISAYVICIICVLCNMFLLSANIHHLFLKPEAITDLFIKQQSNKLFYLSIVILYTLGPSVYLVVDTLSVTCSLKDKVSWFVTIKGTGLNIMLLATEMLYLFYVFRIKRVFKGIPSLALTQCQLYCFYFGFVAQIVAHFISYWYYVQAWDDMTKIIYQKGALRYQYVALGFYVIFVIVVLVTFYYKVYRLLHQTEQINSNKKQSKRAGVFAVRYLLLAAIALLTTITLALVSVFRSTTGLTKMSIIMMKNICLTVDTVVNIMCLYLQFPFADALYVRLCNCCVGRIGFDRRNMKREKNESYKSGDTGFTVETTTMDTEIEALSEKQRMDHGQGRTVDVTQNDHTVFTELRHEDTGEDTNTM
eukprot:48622_1